MFFVIIQVLNYTHYYDNQLFTLLYYLYVMSYKSIDTLV